MFEEYKTVIGSNHLTPEEAFENCYGEESRKLAVSYGGNPEAGSGCGLCQTNVLPLSFWRRDVPQFSVKNLRPPSDDALPAEAFERKTVAVNCSFVIEVKGDDKIDDVVVKAKAEAATVMATHSGVEYKMYAGSVIMKSRILEPSPVVLQGTMIGYLREENTGESKKS